MASPELLKALKDLETDEPILLLEPRGRFDQCLLGIGERFHSRFAVYDRECVLRVKFEDADSLDRDPEADDGQALDEEVREDYEFNILGGWVGEGTPCFLLTKPEEL